MYKYNKRQTKANIVEEERRERTPVKRRRRRRRSKGKHRTHTLECRTVDTELEKRKRELTEAFALIGGSIDKDFGADYVAEG
jgi:hypothetical protein